MLPSKLKLFKNKISYLSKRSIHGYYFTVQPNTKDIIKGESINIYQAPEFNEVHDYLTQKGYYDIIPKSKNAYEVMVETWRNCVLDTSIKSKYFGLLPFLFEDRQTVQAQKKFIVKMDLYTETKFFKFTCLMMSGIFIVIVGFHTFYEPFNDIIPLPAEDFRIRHLVLRSRPPSFVDMDMLYGNRKIANVYCFDQKGVWNPEVKY